MSNQNGLISSRDVCATGATTSNFFIRKGEPIVAPSPFEIVSANGNRHAEITLDNVGTLTIDNTPDLNLNVAVKSNGDITMYPGFSYDLVVETDPADSNEEQGVRITRKNDPNAEALYAVDVAGNATILTSTGGLEIGTLPELLLNNYTLQLQSDATTGQVAITSNATGASDGSIVLRPAENGGDSNVYVITDPGANESAGIKVVNGNAPTQQALFNAGADGSMELYATTQCVKVIGDGVSGTGLVVKPLDELNGAGVLNIQNGNLNANKSRFSIFDSSQNGGGLESGHLQIFGYSGASYGTIAECLNIVPTGTDLYLGDGGAPNGANVWVRGPSGSGRVYDTLYNLLPLSSQVSFTCNGFNYPPGSSDITGATTALALPIGKKLLVVGQIDVTRNGYAQPPISNGNYVVPGPMSVRIELLYTGVVGSAQNTNVILSPLAGNYAFGSALANEGYFLPVVGITEPVPVGATGLCLNAYGSDNTVEMGLNGFSGVFIQLN